MSHRLSQLFLETKFLITNLHADCLDTTTTLTDRYCFWRFVQGTQVDDKDFTRVSPEINCCAFGREPQGTQL